jgi:excisionase family DNA binding protein
MKQRLFTEAEAAKQMTCSAITLWRRRKENKIRHYRKIGRLVRYTQEDIDQIIEESKACRPAPISQRSVTEARFG